LYLIHHEVAMMDGTDSRQPGHHEVAMMDGTDSRQPGHPDITQ